MPKADPPRHPALPPMPAEVLSFGEITLSPPTLIPGDPAKGFVPAYHFRILLAGVTDVGHINLRIGLTPHIQFAAGHIGYTITEPHRGHAYAYQACMALRPAVRAAQQQTLITCDPDNIASRRTIEKLGAIFIDEVAVPVDDPHYARGSRSKLRYEWRA